MHTTGKEIPVYVPDTDEAGEHLHTMLAAGRPGVISYRKERGEDTLIIAQVGNTRVAISTRELLGIAAAQEATR